MLARASAPLRAATRSRSLIQKRNSSSYNAHDDSAHLPFNFPKTPAQKARFGAVLTVFMGFGFFIPFGATIYQLTKAK